MQHSFLYLMVKLWDVSSTGWKMSLEKLAEVRKNPKTLQKSGQDAGFFQPLEQGKCKAERLCPFFLSSWDVHLLTFLVSNSSKSHWRMVHVWGPQGLENKARVAWRLFWPPIVQTQIPFAPFQHPQNYETLQLLSYQFTFLGVFPIWFPLSLFTYCLTVMSPSSPSPSGIVFSLSDFCYLLSEDSAEDPYHQSHPIYILQQYLLMLGVSTISPIPREVQLKSSMNIFLHHYVCFTFLLNFMVLSA